MYTLLAQDKGTCILIYLFACLVIVIGLRPSCFLNFFSICNKYRNLMCWPIFCENHDRADCNTFAAIN